MSAPTHLPQRIEIVRAALALGPETIRGLGRITGMDGTTLDNTLNAMARRGMALREPNLNQSGRQIRQGPKRCPYVWSLA